MSATVLRKKTTHKRAFGKFSSRYKAMVAKWKYHFHNVVLDILRDADEIHFPIDFEPIDKYFSGFKVQYLEASPNENAAIADGQKEIEEGWHYVDIAKGIIFILFDPQVSKQRQRFTKAHEWAHVLQSLDQSFKADMELIPDAAERSAIIESVANHTASFYLVPRVLLTHEMEKLASATVDKKISILASCFNVSRPMMTACLMNPQPIKKQ